MYLNDFSARIPEGDEQPGGYVEMRHGIHYTLKLRTNRDVRCDARVEIDGRHVGTWRLAAHGGITLERPAHDTGRFTFYKLGTPEANAAQLNGSDPNLGLVRVTFTPERIPERRRIYSAISEWAEGPKSPRPLPLSRETTYDIKSRGIPSASCGHQSRSAGGTGLSGASRQQFVDVGGIDYDYSQQTVIHLRLVCKDDHGPRPLTSTSNPVPPRVW